jgi:hypothetical protein
MQRPGDGSQPPFQKKSLTLSSARYLGVVVYVRVFDTLVVISCPLHLRHIVHKQAAFG